jgi:formylglycine-generating enzyme required for sulfatase activity
MATFNPRHSLRQTKTKTGTLLGFRRLVRQGPGVLLPVFRAEDDLLLYQVIGDDGKILAFIEDPDLRPSNLLTPDNMKSAQRAMNIGDPIIRAFETALGDVIFAQTSEFIKKMESSFAKGASYSYPFVTLEVAQFINDGPLEITCARNCVVNLTEISGGLARSWLSKAKLSASARQIAEELLEKILQSKSPGELHAENAQQAHPENFAIFKDRDEHWCPEMVALPAGNFLMGASIGGEAIAARDGPSHAVTLSRRFAIGRYPVTFYEFDYFCTMTGYRKPTDRGWGRGRLPVINVTWQDSQAYLTWLSEATRQQYRLPTEAEWEYACRSGTATAYSWGEKISTDHANCYDTNIRKPTEVGQYPSNPWGLYDMHGNVYEWCDDGYRSYDTSEALDPTGPRITGSLRGARGGSWYETAGGLRSASRAFFAVDSHFVDLGFRCARDLD